MGFFNSVGKVINVFRKKTSQKEVENNSGNIIDHLNGFVDRSFGLELRTDKLTENLTEIIYNGKSYSNGSYGSNEYLAERFREKAQILRSAYAAEHSIIYADARGKAQGKKAYALAELFEKAADKIASGYSESVRVHEATVPHREHPHRRPATTGKSYTDRF